VECGLAKIRNWSTRSRVEIFSASTCIDKVAMVVLDGGRCAFGGKDAAMNRQPQSELFLSWYQNNYTRSFMAKVHSK
jgi:hypothetical protein